MHENAVMIAMIRYLNFSNRIGLDSKLWQRQGYELRAASTVNPEWFIKLVRESLREPLYIIHDQDDCLRWMFSWKGKALIESNLAMKSFPFITIPKRSHSHTRLGQVLWT